MKHDQAWNKKKVVDRSERAFKYAPHRVVYGVTVGVSALKLLRGQLSWLKSQSWDVKLVTTPDSDALAASSAEGVELFPLEMTREISPLADAKALLSWIRVLNRLRPEAVNVSTPKAGLLGGIAAWIIRVPRRLYVVRGLRLEGIHGPLSIVLWLSEWIAMRVATDVLFVSPSLAREANRRKLLKADKSWSIGSGSSNGVDSSAIERLVAETDRGEVRSRLGLANQDFVIGFIGRMAKDKGIETLVQAMNDPALDSRARLVCIGSANDDDVNYSILTMERRALIVPWTDDVWGYLQAFDVLCLPTLREGFPNVVLEAAAAGIPTITTRATGAVDSVIDGETGYLINIGDVPALVSRINALVASPQTLRRMGVAAKLRVKEEFQQVTIWQGLDEILTGVPHPRHAKRMSTYNKIGEKK